MRAARSIRARLVLASCAAGAASNARLHILLTCIECTATARCAYDPPEAERSAFSIVVVWAHILFLRFERRVARWGLLCTPDTALSLSWCMVVGVWSCEGCPPKAPLCVCVEIYLMTVSLSLSSLDSVPRCAPSCVTVSF